MIGHRDAGTTPDRRGRIKAAPSKKVAVDRGRRICKDHVAHLVSTKCIGVVDGGIHVKWDWFAFPPDIVEYSVTDHPSGECHAPYQS